MYKTPPFIMECLMKKEEIERIKNLITEYDPEIIIEYKLNLITTILGKKIKKLGLEHLGSKKKKLFYCAINYFRTDYISLLNPGDMLAINGWRNGRTDYYGLIPYKHSESIDNDDETIFWIKGDIKSLNVVNEVQKMPVVEKNTVGTVDLYPIDVIVTSSSRPDLIPLCMESFKHKLFTRRPLRWLLFEDFVFPKASQRLVKWAESSGIFSSIHTQNPARGLGRMLDVALKKAQSKYIFYLQDDWYLERPVDLDQIIWTMDQYPEINMVTLFKNRIKSVSGFPCPEYRYGDLQLCLYNSWAFLPGVWRVEKVMSKWPAGGFSDHPEGGFTNRFGGHTKRLDVDFVHNAMGTYLYGIPGDPRYVRHLGNNWRMANWRLENGKPGGSIESYQLAEVERAPWVDWFDAPIYDGGEV